MRGRLFFEELAFDVAKPFEFEGIAGGIEEEHGALFPGEAFETNVGFDDEFIDYFAHLFCECLPLIEGHDHAAMGNRDGVIVYGVVDLLDSAVFAEVGIEMNDELVSKHIVVDPVFVASPFWKSEFHAVKLAGFGDVADLYGDVERRQGHFRCFRMISAIVSAE